MTKHTKSPPVPSPIVLVSRGIHGLVRLLLFVRAGGRCQFDACNRYLLEHHVTLTCGNFAQVAHVVAFRERGPRGKDERPLNVNDVTNLMLLCPTCHKLIDDHPGRFTRTVLEGYKARHEERIRHVTDVDPNKRSHVVLYAANIADQAYSIDPEAAKSALFPDWYPAEERPIWLSMNWEGRDDDPAYWKTESTNLKAAFNRQLRPLLRGPGASHLSVFARAPIPLMVLFGSLLTDKVPAETYQLHREPQTWSWISAPSNLSFRVIPPKSFTHPPALVIALSDYIVRSRVSAVLGERVSIWELTVDEPNNDCLKSKEQLSEFRKTARQLMVEIGRAHGKHTPLAIFPAMPVACAVDLGRVRMPKADGPWIIYDQNNKRGAFIRALEIGVTEHE